MDPLVALRMVVVAVVDVGGLFFAILRTPEEEEICCCGCTGWGDPLFILERFADL